MNDPAMLKATVTERELIRDEINSETGGCVYVWPVGDLWACSIRDVVFEANSPSEVFRLLAHCMEEV